MLNCDVVWFGIDWGEIFYKVWWGMPYLVWYFKMRKLPAGLLYMHPLSGIVHGGMGSGIGRYCLALYDL